MPSSSSLYACCRTLTLALAFPVAASAQGHVHPSAKPTQTSAAPADTGGAMMGMAEHSMSEHHHDGVAMLHMQMTPTRPATAADSARARELVAEIRSAIAKYADPADAEADGYKMFLPNVKQQKVYHYTNGRHAIGEAFRFDPSKPTSLLYQPQADGSVKLIGAMYTMPKRAGTDRLDGRIPLSIARWHKHVNWCLPKRGEEQRWKETKDGHPLFGPESPVATKEACDAAGGDFHESLFGWMVHANVFAGDDLGSIFGAEHR